MEPIILLYLALFGLMAVGALSTFREYLLFAAQEEGASAAEPSGSPDLPSQGRETIDPATGRPVILQPIPYEYPDFSDRSDFKAQALPTEDIITYDRAYLKPGEIGELDFTVTPNWSATLRVAPDSRGIDLDGFETAFQERSTVLYENGTMVRLYSNPAGPALALWNKDGFDYALYYQTAEMGLMPGTAQMFQEQTSFTMTE